MNDPQDIKKEEVTVKKEEVAVKEEVTAKKEEVTSEVTPTTKAKRQKVKNKVKRDQYIATGRRKVATSRVRLLKPGNGKIVVNKRSFENYFTRETNRLVIEQPLKLTNLRSKFDVSVNVTGGGMTGQAEATRHGIARALIKSDGTLRDIVKKAGFLTRDPREKERKKYGRKRARKRFQYSKR